MSFGDLKTGKDSETVQGSFIGHALRTGNCVCVQTSYGQTLKEGCVVLWVSVGVVVRRKLKDGRFGRLSLALIKR